MLTQLTIFLYIIIFLYGIVIGSFLNVCILRIPRKENIASHSHCMTCGRKLGWRDMVPVFSYIFLRGRCRQCGAKISIQYPLIEALNGVLYVIVFMANGFTFSSVLYCLMTSALIVITVIDERTFRIPVTFNLFIGLLGIIMTVYDYRHIVSHLIGAFCVSLFLYGLYYFSSGKAIGGGIPCGAFGLSAELADRIRTSVELEDIDVGGIGGTLRADGTCLCCPD